jgi:hypothetical protein
LKFVSPPQAKHRGNVQAVIDVGDEAPPGDLDLCRLGRQGDGKDAVDRGDADGLGNLASFRRDAALGGNSMLFRTGRSGEAETKQDRRQRTDSPDFHSSLPPNMTPIIYFLVEGWARSKMGNAVASPMLPMEVEDAEGSAPSAIVLRLVGNVATNFDRRVAVRWQALSCGVPRIVEAESRSQGGAKLDNFCVEFDCLGNAL